jgi:hypothetical protein
MFEPRPWDRVGVGDYHRTPMTAKEQLLQEVPDWSEHDAEIALRAVRHEHVDGGDEWGELSKVHEVAFGETMKRLAEEESAAGHEPW